MSVEGSLAHIACPAQVSPRTLAEDRASSVCAVVAADWGIGVPGTERIVVDIGVVPLGGYPAPALTAAFARSRADDPRVILGVGSEAATCQFDLHAGA
jgi:hypothetical protein